MTRVTDLILAHVEIFLKKSRGMAQLVRALDAKSKELISIPIPHDERRALTPTDCLFTRTHTHTQTINVKGQGRNQ